MKLYVDTNGKQVTVTKDPVAKNDGQTDRQKTERGTGRPMWSTQVFVLDDDGGEVITVTTAGEVPNVKVGRPYPDPRGENQILETVKRHLKPIRQRSVEPRHGRHRHGTVWPARYGHASDLAGYMLSAPNRLPNRTPGNVQCKWQVTRCLVTCRFPVGVAGF